MSKKMNECGSVSERMVIFLYSSHILVKQKWEIFIGVKRKESNE